MRKLLLITTVIMSLSGISNAYYYYLGPFVETVDQVDGATVRSFPDGAVGVVDLSCRDIPNVAFFTSTKTLPAGYTSFGEGDIKTIDVNLATRVKWRNIMGYLPRGQNLSDLLWDQLTDGSDPTGITAPKPLIPTSKGKLNLKIGGHQTVRSETFHWGDFHTNKIKAEIMIDLWKARQDSIDGKMINPITKQVDRDYHRRILQAYCDKYKVAWTILRPANWPLSEDPLSRNTDISDRWLGSGADLGYDLTWTELVGTWANDGGYAYFGGVQYSYARCDSDLDTDDMYAQIAAYASGSGRMVSVRYQSDANTCYTALETPYDGFYIRKVVAGARTNLSSNLDGPDVNTVLRFEVDGSDLEVFLGETSMGSTTDTSITGNLRAGVGGYGYGSWIKGPFEAGDLGGAPPAVASHERRRVVIAQ